MKKTIQLIITLLVANALFSQAPSKQALDSAQYQIIRATVDFLATDTKTFGKVKGACTNCKVNDYEALKKYADDNKLAKVPDLINEWKKESLDTTEAGWIASVESFKKKVRDKIADGEKKERQKLIGYEDYRSRLDSIINRLKSSINSPQSLGQEPMIGGSNPDITENDKKAGGDDTYIVGLLTWQNISLVASVIFFTGIIILIIKRNKKKITALKSIIAELKEKRKNEIEKLRWEIETIEVEKEKLKDVTSRLEEELKIEKETAKINKQQHVVEEQKPTTIPKPENKIKYACYADQGDGFSISSLLNQSNSEAIFEINLTTSSTANYKISNDKAIQRYALSNAAFFLGTTCKYDTEPNNQQGIVTEKAGELKLQGNKWLITAPAIISFR